MHRVGAPIRFALLDDPESVTEARQRADVRVPLAG